MAGAVIYFPFIRVPKSDWLTRILLYWDNVRTITPYEFLEEPERFGPHTQGLVQQGLIEPIYPGEYVHTLGGFEENFLEYLNSHHHLLESRRERFASGQYAPVHLEKLGTLRPRLKELRLAKEEGQWSLIEAETAEEFMAYLATVLGKLPDVEAIPVSDQEAGIARLAPPSVGSDIDIRLGQLRMAVLDDVFPSPSRPLEAAEIATFKNKHRSLLTRFRLEVEREVIRLADFDNDELRDAAKANLSDRIQEDIREIKSKLGESGFGPISTSKWLAVLGHVPFVGNAFSLLASVSGLFEREQIGVTGPFAYAGYVGAKLLNR